MSRILFFPGFGEDAFAFDELKAFFPKDILVDIDYRPILDKFTFPFISPKVFAKNLIKYYKIHPHDKLIGHSMGGYFAFYIREIQANEICMIGAFSDPAKIRHAVPQFPRATSLFNLTGLIKTRYVKNYLLKRTKGDELKHILEKTVNNFDNFSNLQLAKMNEMCFFPTVHSTQPNPLRLHDKADRVVEAPEEPYIQIGGGHFLLNIEPKACYEAMVAHGFV